jgi:hypothetical protein
MVLVFILVFLFLFALFLFLTTLLVRGVLAMFSFCLFVFFYGVRFFPSSSFLFVLCLFVRKSFFACGALGETTVGVATVLMKRMSCDFWFCSGHS